VGAPAGVSGLAALRRRLAMEPALAAVAPVVSWEQGLKLVHFSA